MHQSSLETSWQEQARDADFLDCASLPDYATAGSLAAPVVVGKGCASPEIRILVNQQRSACTPVYGVVREGFEEDGWSYGLDAPNCLPSGGHSASDPSRNGFVYVTGVTYSDRAVAFLGC